MLTEASAAASYDWSAIGFTGAVIIGLGALFTGAVVPRGQIKKMEKQFGIALAAKDTAYTAMVTEKDAQITRLQSESDAKNLALERKDTTIQDMQAGMLKDALPSLARAALILERFHTDTTVRRVE